MKLPQAIIVDVDFTVANNGHRDPYDFSEKVLDDLPIVPMIHLVNGLVQVSKYYPIFLTGRNEICREHTKKWLDKHFNFKYTLIMKALENQRGRTSIFKEKMYKEQIQDQYNVFLVIDDDNRNVKMFRSLGLDVLQPHILARKN